MAVQWHPESGVVRTRHGYAAPPEKIITLPEISGRSEATDVTELAADIAVNGQLQPAICWKNEHGFPVLLAGHRRYRAIATINKGKREENRLQLEFIYNESKTEEEAFDYTIRENRNRMEPTPMDDAYNMHVYQTRFNLSVEQIAKKYFPGIKGEDIKKAVKKVEDTLQLLELSEDLKEKLQTGDLPTSAAQQLASIPSRLTQEKVAKIAENYSKKTNPKTGNKTLQVEAVKQAKAEVTGKTRTPISENTPAKLLEKFKKMAEIASALSYETLALNGKFKVHGDKLVALEYAEQIAVMCYHLKVSQDTQLKNWAEDHKDLPTVLTGEAQNIAVVA